MPGAETRRTDASLATSTTRSRETAMTRTEEAEAAVVVAITIVIVSIPTPEAPGTPMEDTTVMTDPDAMVTTTSMFLPPPMIPLETKTELPEYAAPPPSICRSVLRTRSIDATKRSSAVQIPARRTSRTERSLLRRPYVFLSQSDFVGDPVLEL